MRTVLFRGFKVINANLLYLVRELKYTSYNQRLHILINSSYLRIEYSTLQNIYSFQEDRIGQLKNIHSYTISLHVERDYYLYIWRVVSRLIIWGWDLAQTWDLTVCYIASCLCMWTRVMTKHFRLFCIRDSTLTLVILYNKVSNSTLS